MNYSEKALTFDCGGETLVGVLSQPIRTTVSSRGVLIVVGGPQYRVGSHRQFTLLARNLAEQGIAVLRFDYRGMGDSSGDRRAFDDLHDDIGSALDILFAQLPFLRDAVIWGLCDAALAALLYCNRDPRVTGLVAVNPDVRTIQVEARSYLKHYYVSRVFSRQLWQKISSGEFAVTKSIKSFATILRNSVALRRERSDNANTNESTLTVRIMREWERFDGRVLLLLSGDDLTAKAFSEMVSGSRRWQRLIGNQRCSRHDLPEANHTFSRREWRDQVASLTADWIRSW